MSVCTRCGITAWHPEAFACTATDCEIRLPTPLPVAADPNTSSRPLAGGVIPCATGGSVDQDPRDRETDGLGGQVQGAGVHIHSATAKEARHHG